ncbi:MAG: 7-cyano-7-deazaguanine synthase, partial [Phycisphaerae bacterium]
MGEAGRKAVILLSGGLDSATTAAVAGQRGFALHALTIRYGQRHEIEIAAARRVGEAMRVADHVIQTIDLRAFGGSALTDDIQVHKSADVAGIARDI